MDVVVFVLVAAFGRKPLRSVAEVVLQMLLSYEVCDGVAAMYAEFVSISPYWNRGRSTYLQSIQHFPLARLTLTIVT